MLDVSPPFRTSQAMRDVLLHGWPMTLLPPLKTRQPHLYWTAQVTNPRHLPRLQAMAAVAALCTGPMSETR